MGTYTLLMIGAGRMAEAVTSGLVKQNDPLFSRIVITNRSDKHRLAQFKRMYEVEVSNDWKSVVHDVDVVLLATPPHTHEEIFKEISPALKNQLIITVAAGIDPTYMESQLPEGTPVCWIMPNTAALVQRSISTFTTGKYVDGTHRKMIEHILSSIGDYEELSEQQVHDLTAITGSAPAFIYLITEALEEAAQSYGISSDQARLLVTKMISGSAAMLDTGLEASQLRDQVTTPGGSTAAGIDVLTKYDVKEIMKEAVLATNQHARKNH